MMLINRHSLLFVSLLLTLNSCHSEDVLQKKTTRTETFKQQIAAKIDILWVVDNSNSMHEEQQALAESFDRFMQQLEASQVNYHVGVITTDPAQGGTLRSGQANLAVYENNGAPWPFEDTPTQKTIITPDTEAPLQVFKENISVGTFGAAQEKGFETTAMALGIDYSWDASGTEDLAPVNPDFIRPEASLFIIMVSDEDDTSLGTITYYYRVFEAYKGKGNDNLISISAIVGDPITQENPYGGCKQTQRGNADPGERYIELAALTGGVATSICSDFSESLTELSYAAAGLSNRFGPLSTNYNQNSQIACGELYSEEALCVRINDAPIIPHEYDGQTNEGGWSIEEDNGQIFIRFHGDDLPPPEATVSVEFIPSLS